ncbi:MAG: hypothetical protein LBH87_02290 [Coriobacteriales bacterium]|jgi:hypothetical protein|nr:hypothetical protein [Coriobacteriales bacterium]
MNDKFQEKLLQELEKLNKSKKITRIWWWILGWAAIGSVWAMFLIWISIR